jgi:hypothetical protein
MIFVIRCNDRSINTFETHATPFRWLE